jgi:hypothetical protein
MSERFMTDVDVRDAFHQAAKVPELEYELQELRAFKEQINGIATAIMSESCDASERHCTCVPVLRNRVSELEREIERRKDERLKLAIEFGKSVEDRFAKDREIIELRERLAALIAAGQAIIDDDDNHCKSGHLATMQEAINAAQSAQEDAT